MPALILGFRGISLWDKVEKSAAQMQNIISSDLIGRINLRKKRVGTKGVYKKLTKKIMHNEGKMIQNNSFIFF